MRWKTPSRALKTSPIKRKDIFDEDIFALLDAESASHDRIRLESLHITCGTVGPQTAMIALRVEGEVYRATVEGNGPLDAVFNAIRAIAPHTAELKLYQVSALTAGTDAQAEVSVRLGEETRLANGHGTDIDTLVASARAYIDALNRLEAMKGARIRDLTDFSTAVS